VTGGRTRLHPMPERQPYVPEYCVWELTLRCNLRCLHCGSKAGRARADELTLEECLPVADELAALGCRQASLIGGEVFLYRGWERVARRLADRGVQVNTITNGLVLDDSHLAEIRHARLSNVCLSLDGLREAHNTIRGVRTSFDRAVATMARLRSEDIPVAVVTTLTALNVDDLPGLYELLVAHGVETWQIQLATPMGNMARARHLLLEPARVPGVTRFIREHRDAARLWILAGDDIGYYDKNEIYLRNQPGSLGSWQGCSAGLRAVGIDSEGNVKGCESLYDPRFVEGNLRTRSLSEIWNDAGAFSYNRRFEIGQLGGTCTGCDKGARCRGGCRGVCFFTSDGLFTNPYCCYPGRPSSESESDSASDPQAAGGPGPQIRRPQRARR